MMVRPVRTATRHLGTGNGVCVCFSANLRTDRDIVPGSEIFRVKKGEHTYFIGHANVSGNVQWIRKASGKLLKTNSTYCRNTGQFMVAFLEGPLEDGEELSVTYKWRPHYLSDAQVYVRLNGEDRLVPIRDLQQAIGTDLSEEE
jgi:hypothetical protein